MTTSSEQEREGDRDHRSPSRGAGLARLAAAGLVAVLALGGSWAYAAAREAPEVGSADGPTDDPSDGGSATRRTLAQGWQDRSEAISAAAAGGEAAQQVLGGELRAGVPTVQRLVHDRVPFTLSVAPARPGRNLVRVDTTGHPHGERVPPVLVGTDEGDLVRARPRPGTDGLWASVELPPGEGTVLVTHGPVHRIPFTVETGQTTDGPAPSRAWAGADAPECLSAATATLLSGRAPDLHRCPADRLRDPDADALRATVATLAGRGVEELALHADDSPRSVAASQVVRSAAEEAGVTVVAPTSRPGTRNALLDVAGWDASGRSLAEVSGRPQAAQPVRSDGAWLAPWLLSRGVVDSTSGAVLALDFDIRDAPAQDYGQTLATFLPGQAPTASGYAAWSGGAAGRRDEDRSVRLFAAARAAYMPASPGHAGHETEVSWFPGGTITPVGTTGTTPPAGD